MCALTGGEGVADEAVLVHLGQVGDGLARVLGRPRELHRLGPVEVHLGEGGWGGGTGGIVSDLMGEWMSG